MRKVFKMKSFMFFIFVSSVLSCKSQKIDCDCSAILIPKQIEIPLYNEYGKHNIKNRIINDTIKEEYYILNIFKIVKQYALVSAFTPFDSTHIKGWIKTQYLGIYPSNFSTINLYFKPNKTSKVKAKIIKPEYYPFNILDCNGKWLYIKYFDVDKKFKEGWLSPEDQCSNPYSTCN